MPKELKDFQLKSTLDEDIMITESSDQDSSMKMIVESLFAKNKIVDSRKEARFYNILDMNIVPINLHALMREIPLINLINYSYTCDHMIQTALCSRTFGDPDNKDIIMPENHPTANATTKEFLAKTLIYPHSNAISFRDPLMQRIIAGDSSIGLQRPKFIGDQLWNKSLLRNLYSDVPINNGARGAIPPLDEVGPSVYSIQRRVNLVKNPEDHLQYPERKDNELKLVDVNLPIAPAPNVTFRDLNSIGEDRFQTTFMRNMLFLVNLQRVTRMIMRNEVSYLESPVVNSSSVINKQITEYEGNEQYDHEVFHQ